MHRPAGPLPIKVTGIDQIDARQNVVDDVIVLIVVEK
jgi:hypothetical protein